MNLGYGIKFADLYDIKGLCKIDDLFIEQLTKHDIELSNQLLKARAEDMVDSQHESELIIKLASFTEIFIIHLFNIVDATHCMSVDYNDIDILFACRRNFVQRVVQKQMQLDARLVSEKLASSKKILSEHNFNFSSEIDMAKMIAKWQQEQNETMLYHAAIYAYHMIYRDDNKSVLFSVPRVLNFNQLVDFVIEKDGVKATSKKLRNRIGFELNDDGVNDLKAICESKYCIHCHKQQKDSCAHGMKSKETDAFATNILGIKLEGCPLREKISEMNFLKAHSFVITPLAVAIIDNPMVAGTGHRICNDCMKACIYQKQDPVNIPFIETAVLNSVLNLPYGFEIYSLLTRWNPLNFAQWLPKEMNEHKVLVVGLGPAGYTLSHYLLNAGVTVVAIDGLKIEPLPKEISGIDIAGKRRHFQPLRDINTIYENLDERKAGGFGGVAEYGITVRWNKNYLQVLRLLLERRSNFRMYGSVRFGSNLTYKQVLNLGFAHIALALGAGSPSLPNISNITAKGVRTASDFLMSLQLSHTAHLDNVANLQIELPIVVIGGGLTAVDAATEAMNYYAAQVRKVLLRYQQIGDQIFANLDNNESLLLKKFLHHAEELNRHQDQKSKLLQSWGGSTILYRKDITESPSYKLNHEELAKALEEGIYILDHAVPNSIEIDQHNHCRGISYNNGKFIEARTILIAVGTTPNIVLAQEDSQNFQVHQQYFDIENMHNMSVFGDLHPQYKGNVVRAMASAKNGYQKVLSRLESEKKSSALNTADFFQLLDNLLLSRVLKVNQLTTNIIEVIIKSSMCAENFAPGQFYRLQNYHQNTQKLSSNITSSMEPLALTGACVDKSQGVLSLIVLEMLGSSNFCRYLQEGEYISLMGPTGTPTSISTNQKVMLIGGGLGNAVLFSIGLALRKAGNEVLYFAGYKKTQDRYKQQEIENAADVVVWCCEENALEKAREQDFSLQGNIIKAVEQYHRLQNQILLHDIDRIIIIGSDKMMAAFTYARNSTLQEFFKPECDVIASINAPMQCMMKKICGQCIQRHVNPMNGNISYVYSCAEQDQDASFVDFQCLHNRLSQNALLEKISHHVLQGAYLDFSYSSIA